MEQFVDRDIELDQLTDCYESERADFVVIYGRRRLGKSELVRQSIADWDDAVYYQAVESTAPNQLEQFVGTVTTQFSSLSNVRRDWEVLLEALGEEDAVVVIDESVPHRRGRVAPVSNSARLGHGTTGDRDDARARRFVDQRDGRQGPLR